MVGVREGQAIDRTSWAYSGDSRSGATRGRRSRRPENHVTVEAAARSGRAASRSAAAKDRSLVLLRYQQ